MGGSGITDPYALPDDWIYEVEAIMLRLVPAYTLETLDTCDVDRLLNYYFWDYRKALHRKEADEDAGDPEENIVYRNGKPYRKVAAKDAAWANDIF